MVIDLPSSGIYTQEEAIVYDDIHKQPNRKKCALLSWWGIEKLLNELEAQK